MTLINGRTAEEIKDGLSRCGGRNRCRGNEYGDCCPYYVDCIMYQTRLNPMKDAIALIERLESERDAALAYMKRARICTECAHWDCGIDEPCMHCDHENNCFEWRGIQPPKEGE